MGKYIKVIWELDRKMEDNVVAHLFDLGALGFEMLPGKHREVELIAYFNVSSFVRMENLFPGILQFMATHFPDSYEAPRFVVEQEKDWVQEWKKNYHATHVSKKIVVCPSWESYQPVPGEKVIYLDPGQAFGTGLHESTVICIQEMESFTCTGIQILDLGSGSGILSIAGILFGAARCISIDKDITACRITRINAHHNQVLSRIFPVCADILQGIPRGNWDLILANLLPEILLKILYNILPNSSHKITTVFSGIPSGEEGVFIKEIDKRGFKNVQLRELNNWILIRFEL